MIECAIQSLEPSWSGVSGCMPDGALTKSEEERGRLDELSDEALVDEFLAAHGDRSRAHLCFEILMTRYQWLINHIVRSSRFRFPAWDSPDDVIARIAFKTYRGLGQWRREGKLSSFIARIASSELIDAIRHVSRDKSWDPFPARQDSDSARPSEIEQARSREASPEAAAVNKERRRIVNGLLAEVCKDWKDSVIISDYIIGARSGKEVSEKYSISEDLVYQRARRLKVRLMKSLEGRGITSADQLFGGQSGKK
ncbi:MAG: hypothetical protein DMF61_26565 [Blastocatellia bacterium AA13]|nr:MAG: hypothetical protein DMF61_26565 [Blastocatellia bacterium AA13]